MFERRNTRTFSGLDFNGELGGSFRDGGAPLGLSKTTQKKLNHTKKWRMINEALKNYLPLLPELSSFGEIDLKSNVIPHGLSDFAAMFVAAR